MGGCAAYCHLGCATDLRQGNSSSHLTMDCVIDGRTDCGCYLVPPIEFHLNRTLACSARVHLDHLMWKRVTCWSVNQVLDSVNEERGRERIPVPLPRQGCTIG
jgi:hypothetical protein